MNPSTSRWLALLCSLALASINAAEQPSDAPEMTEARQMGLTVMELMQKNLENREKADFPGINAWVSAEGKSLAKIDKGKPDPSWRNLDGDKLITHSANFWQLYYEVAPGDPGLAMLHAGCLLAAGDADRAQTILRLTMHRNDLDDGTIEILTSVMQSSGSFMRPSHALVQEGVKLHDGGDYAGALAKYDAALRLWPLNGWAAFERGMTFRIRDGEGDPVKQAFAQARRIQPFQWHAWQGTVKELPGMLSIHKVVHPIWEKSLADIRYVMTVAELESMSEALQEAEIDDLALVARQILIVRKGRYMPEDHPFISKSLRRLVPGKQAETTIGKLREGVFKAIQIFKAPTPGEAK